MIVDRRMDINVYRLTLFCISSKISVNEQYSNTVVSTHNLFFMIEPFVLLLHTLSIYFNHIQHLRFFCGQNCRYINQILSYLTMFNILYSRAKTNPKEIGRKAYYLSSQRLLAQRPWLERFKKGNSNLHRGNEPRTTTLGFYFYQHIFCPFCIYFRQLEPPIWMGNTASS